MGIRSLYRYPILSALILGGFGMQTASAARRDLPLVIRGEPNATVVLPDDATPPLREAAADLVRVIERMSGARLRTVSDPE
ncbi:hypothetical protein AMK68_01670, partial [candidate division KD3-62 bacterium DG_56]